MISELRKRLMSCDRGERCLPLFLSKQTELPIRLAGGQFCISTAFLSSTVAQPTQTQRATVTLKMWKKKEEEEMSVFLVHLACSVSYHATESWN